MKNEKVSKFIPICVILIMTIVCVGLIGTAFASDANISSDSNIGANIVVGQDISFYSDNSVVEDNLINSSNIDNSLSSTNSNIVSDNSTVIENTQGTNVQDNLQSTSVYSEYNSVDSTDSVANGSNVNEVNIDNSSVYNYNIDEVSSEISTYDYADDSIFVDSVNGLDTNTGLSWDQAVQTINQALNLVTAGNTIYIANGTYKGASNVAQTINKNNISLIANYTGGVVFDGETLNRIFTINANNVNFEGLNFTQGLNENSGKLVYINKGKSLNVVDCKFNNTGTVSGSGAAITLVAGSQLNSSNCIFDNLAAVNGAAIFANANSNLTIVNNTFTNLLLSGTPGRGGSVFVNPNCVANIYNSTFDNCKGANIGSAILSKSNAYIENCNFTNNDAYSGGAIADGETRSITLTIANSSFVNNKASGTTGKGGALYLTASKLNLINCDFINDYARGRGGAVFLGYADNTLYAENCLFESCYSNGNAVSAGTASGGAITLWGSASIINSVFNNNKAAGYGGAILANTGDTILLSNCSFENNSVTAIKTNYGCGGAVYAGPGFSMDVIDSSFINNTAVKGAAIYIVQDDSVSGSTAYVNVSDSYFEGNNADLIGGAIYSDNIVNITNSNFVNNTADNGALLYSTNGDVTLNYNRIIDNVAKNGLEIAIINSLTGDLNNNWWGINDPMESDNWDSRFNQAIESWLNMDMDLTYGSNNDVHVKVSLVSTTDIANSTTNDSNSTGDNDSVPVAPEVPVVPDTDIGVLFPTLPDTNLPPADRKDEDEEENDDSDSEDIANGDNGVDSSISSSSDASSDALNTVDSNIDNGINGSTVLSSTVANDGNVVSLRSNNSVNVSTGVANSATTSSNTSNGNSNSSNGVSNALGVDYPALVDMVNENSAATLLISLGSIAGITAIKRREDDDE